MTVIFHSSELQTQAEKDKFFHNDKRKKEVGSLYLKVPEKQQQQQQQQPQQQPRRRHSWICG